MTSLTQRGMCDGPSREPSSQSIRHHRWEHLGEYHPNGEAQRRLAALQAGAAPPQRRWIPSWSECHTDPTHLQVVAYLDLREICCTTQLGILNRQLVPV